jgi:hypothetical protein
MSGVTVVLLTIMTSFAPEGVVRILSLFSLLPRTLMLYVLPAVFFLKFFKFKALRWSIPALIALASGIVVTCAALYWGIRRVAEAWAT